MDSFSASVRAIVRCRGRLPRHGILWQQKIPVNLGYTHHDQLDLYNTRRFGRLALRIQTLRR